MDAAQRQLLLPAQDGAIQRGSSVSEGPKPSVAHSAILTAKTPRQ